MDFIVSRILTGPFLITIIRYALVAAGTWLVSNGYLTEEVWQQVLGGVLAIVLAFMGGTEATKDKANFNGKSVPLDTLPEAAQASVKSAVTAPTKKRTLLDMFIGK